VLTPSTQATLTAQVADPDGPGDVQGGALTDDQGASYGQFSAPLGSGGAYTIAISWSAVAQHRTLTFGQGGSASVTLTATFYDYEGHSASRQLSLTLECDQSNQGACYSACVDLLSNPQDCGSCGHAAYGDLECVNGQLQCPSGQSECTSGTCINLQSDYYNCGACGNSCDAWLNTHYYAGTDHAFCLAGACTAAVYVQQPTQYQSCSAICGASGATCVVGTDCAADNGVSTPAIYAGCGSYYESASGSVYGCYDDQPLSCSDVPSAQRTCQKPVSPSITTWSLMGQSCLCR
jgi:hypothetical protein